MKNTIRSGNLSTFLIQVHFSYRTCECKYRNKLERNRTVENKTATSKQKWTAKSNENVLN